MAKLNTLAIASGFSVSILRSDEARGTAIIGCWRSGKPTRKDRPQAIHSTKTDCPFRIHLSCLDREGWAYLMKNKGHNHPVSPLCAIPAARQLSTELRKTVTALALTGSTPKRIHRFIRALHPDHPVNAQDIANFIFRTVRRDPPGNLAIEHVENGPVHGRRCGLCHGTGHNRTNCPTQMRRMALRQTDGLRPLSGFKIDLRV